MPDLLTSSPPTVMTDATSSLYDTYHDSAQGEDMVHAGLLAPGTVPVPEREVYAKNREPWMQKYARESVENEEQPQP